MVNRRDRVSIAALIDSFLALHVERIGGSKVVQRSQPALDVPQICEVHHQISEIRDQIAVSSEQLVETFAPILLAALVVAYDLGIATGGPVNTREAAILCKRGIGCPALKPDRRGKSQKTCNRRARVNLVTRPQPVGAMASQVHQNPEPALGIGNCGTRAVSRIRAIEERSKAHVPGWGIGEQRYRGAELDAASQRIASILSAARPAQNFAAFDTCRVNQIEKGVYTASHSSSRVTDAVHEYVDLIARQASNEDPGNRGTRALPSQARLLI